MFHRNSIACVMVLLASGLIGAQTTIGTVAGSTDGDRAGSSLAAGAYAGTTDAVAIGLPQHDPGAAALAGRVLVRSAAGTTLLDLAGAAGEELGFSVALGGDADNDGQLDLLVGAPGRDPGLGASQGSAFVVSGATGMIILTVDGVAAGDRFGAAVAWLGDLNGDMRADFAVGAPLHDTAGADAGRVTIHSGADGSVLQTADGGFVDAAFGSALASAGDVNADGSTDLIAGAPNADVGAVDQTGRVRIVSGADGSDLLTVDGAAMGDRLGAAVSTAGDHDEDGTPDLLLGAPGLDGAAGADSGAALVVSGATGTTLLTVEGSAAGAAAGTAVAGGIDLTRDGLADLVIGEPSQDGAAGADTGRVAVHDGRDGSLVFALEGAAAGEAEGSAVAAGGQFDDDLRPDLFSGAPLAAEGGTERGRVSILGLSTAATARVDVFDATVGARAVARGDVDGDGDLDLVIASGSTVSVIWNGDQVGTLSIIALDTTARLDVALSAGASATSVAVGQWDADTALEIVVGRDDGSIDLIDGTGSGATTALALTGTSPFAVDTAAPAGPINDVAVLGTGASAEIVAAGQGTIANAGFVTRVQTPLGVPTLTAAVLTGGTFASVVIGDIDGDSNADIIAANSSNGSFGGVHVFAGPTFAAATGSPFAAGVIPNTVNLADLDGDGTRDDAVVTSLGIFGSGGARVLPDYVAGGGFSPSVDLGLTFARDASVGELDGQTGDDVALLDGAGALSIQTGWTGSAFTTTTAIPIAEAAGIALSTVQLTAGITPEDYDEIAVVHATTGRVSVWHRYVPSLNAPIASTGCPTSGSIAQIALTKDTVLGTLLTDIQLTGASAFSPAFLAAQLASPPGTAPTVSTVGGCGIAMGNGDILQYFTFTDITGSARLPGGIPNDPALIGREFVLQWGIFDGGPILGSITASDAVLVRFGEI